MPAARVTVTLPPSLVREMDRHETNRSRFVLEAIREHLRRRRRRGLRESLDAPHPESRRLADLGLSDWARRVPARDAEGLVDARAGRAVRWSPGRGWREIGR